MLIWLHKLNYLHLNFVSLNVCVCDPRWYSRIESKLYVRKHREVEKKPTQLGLMRFPNESFTKYIWEWTKKELVLKSIKLYG